VFGNAVAGKRGDFVGNPDLPHTYSYVPDIAAGLATLGTDERAIGGVWHLPGPETVTTRELLELVAADVGHPVGVRVLLKLAVRALGLFNPTIRELVELSYEFEQPFVLNTSKYESTFGTMATPLKTAVTATVNWYANRNGGAGKIMTVADTERFREFSNPATGERIQVTVTAEDSEEDLVRFNWRSMPGGSITEHLHPHQEERFIISAGEAHLTVNGEERIVGPGRDDRGSKTS
jgi:hypothetical protein